MHSRRRGRTQALTAILTMALVVIAAGSAGAATVTTGTRSVSCDGSTYANIGTTVATGGAKLNVRQLSTSPSGVTSVVRVVPVLGTSGPQLGPTTISTGPTGVTWTNFAAGKYQVQIRRSGSANCNGALPGNGNYSVDWLIAEG